MPKRTIELIFYKKGWVKDAFIDNDVFGSDHCPVSLILEI